MTTQRNESAAEERLAPVTYLHGARPEAGPPEGADAEPGWSQGLAGDASENRAGDAGRSRHPAGTKASTRAANVSVHQLARRGMSRWELGQVLDKRGVPDDAADAELDRLESVGLLDDAALAVSLVYAQHKRKGLGRTAIEHDLRRRRIDPEIIADALSEIDDDEEREAALQLAEKRARQLASLDDETAKRRLSGYLARKGYSSDIVRAAVDSALSHRSNGVRFR